MVSLRFGRSTAGGACPPVSAAAKALRAGCIDGACTPRLDPGEVIGAAIDAVGTARAEGIGPRIELVSTVTSPGVMLMLVWW